MNSDEHTDNQLDVFRKKLAKWLGLTYDELEEFAEDVEPNHGGNGNGKYGYYLQFSDATPPEIVQKIKRLDNNYTLYFNLEELDARF